MNQLTVRILVVEDNEADFVLIRHLLQASSLGAYVTEWASSYEEAVKKLHGEKFDVCLFDYGLGEKNGIDLLKHLNVEGYRGPIILLTGNQNPSIDLEASTAGAADFLCKNSLDTAQLERSIRYSLRHASTLEALRSSQERLEVFMRHVPCAVYIKDHDGRYVYSNETGRKMLECEFEDWRDKTDAEIWPEDEAQRMVRTDRHVLSSLQAAQAIEVLSNTNGKRHWLASKFPMVIDNKTKPLLGVAAVDITDLIHAEEKLKQTTQILNTVLSSLPVIVGRIDQDGMIREVRGQGLAAMGLKDNQLVGKKIHEIYPQIADYVKKALKGETTSFIWTLNNKAKIFHLDSHFFFDAEYGGGAVFFTRDVTERRLLEKTLLDITEEQQQRIGQDLHDGLGQYLTGIACLTTALQEKLQLKLPSSAPDAETIAKLVQETIAQTRALARGLCPIELETTGLESALEDLTFNIQRVHKIDCRLETDNVQPIKDHSVAMHLYRITQEALNNAIKHAKASKILVSLRFSNSGNVLSIQDDGCGFKQNQHKHPSMGLRMMNYRATMIDASLTISSEPKQGTKIECSFNFAKYETKKG